MHTSRHHLTWVAAAVLALGLAACDRRDENANVGAAGTSSSTTTTTETTAERKMDQAGDNARAAVNQAGNAAENAAESAKTAVGDAAITTAVNAALAADSQLSALQINVDTENGRVLLKGSAPNADAKNRATTIAQGVSGVTSVENQLQVQ